MNPLDADMIATVGQAFHPAIPDKIGIAVSGGGDSIALLHVMSTWADGAGVALHVVTVDHGLRPEAAEEARFVAKVAADLGHSHDTLPWHDWDGSGNLQDSARTARYELISAWAKSRNIAHVALGHTADDVAETFVMRLAREAGVDGLAAMKARRLIDGITYVRPILLLERETLRDFLRRHGHKWIEDPSNDDLRFERVRVRRAMQALDALGIGRDTLATVAHNLASAREALSWQTFLMAKNAVHAEGGCIVIDRKLFRTFHDEIARRLLVHSLKWVATARYGPRRATATRVLEAIRHAKVFTLHGCHVGGNEGTIRIYREYNAIKDHIVHSSSIWDNRWKLVGPAVPGAVLRALGTEGLRQCRNWRETNLPADVLMATPALWQGEVLIAAPFAGQPREWSIELINTEDDFFSSLMTH